MSRRITPAQHSQILSLHAVGKQPKDIAALLDIGETCVLKYRNLPVIERPSAPVALRAGGPATQFHTDRFYVSLFDLHYGTEKDVFTGHNKPIHNQRGLDALCSMMVREKPNAFVFGGDALNCGPVNHHEKFQPLRLEGQRMGRDITGFKKNVLDVIDELMPEGATKIWLYGNHEQWLWQFGIENPGVADLLNMDDLLGLKARGWQVFHKGGLANIGNLYFTHGDVALKTGSRGHAAKKLVEEYKLSVRAGHLHTDQTYTSHRALVKKEGDLHNGRIVPCMCDLSPGYTPGKPNNWVCGFNSGYVRKDGAFWDANTLLIDNGFMFNGHHYQG